jgi:hypothetical protein
MPKLDWIGKKAVVNHHREVPFHLLQSNGELSVGTKWQLAWCRKTVCVGGGV